MKNNQTNQENRANHLPPDENRSEPQSVKREEAGLLWVLLPRAARHRIAALLERNELEELNRSYHDYRSHPRAERFQVESRLRRAIAPGFIHLPLIIFATLGIIFLSLFILHYLHRSGFSTTIRLYIFAPLMMGVFAPLSLYFMPAIRRRMLFTPRFSFKLGGSALLTFIALIWTLFFIGELEGWPNSRLDGLTLLVITLGAATAPLLEEVIFRELIPDMVGNPPHYVGHLVAAAIFSVSHMPAGMEMFILYLMAGLLLGALRIVSEGLFYPLLVHSMANLTYQLVF